MQSKNKPLFRYLEKPLRQLIADKYSCLILGPRQVGKTTLVKKCLKTAQDMVEYPLQNPSLRIELEANPSRLISQIEALNNKPYVFIDEAQKNP